MSFLFFGYVLKNQVDFFFQIITSTPLLHAEYLPFLYTGKSNSIALHAFLFIFYKNAEPRNSPKNNNKLITNSTSKCFPNKKKKF